MVKLSLLHQGLLHPNWQSEDDTANSVIDQLFELVPKAEQFGFNRFWLGEHYENDVAWRSPEILIALLLGCTERIRIGVGGLLLNLHKPLSVVNNFNLLSYLFPDRVDLGIGKGMAFSAVMEILGELKLNLDDYEKDYENKLETLFSLFENTKGSEIEIPPYHTNTIQTWLFGTGSGSIKKAVAHKTGFCFYALQKNGSRNMGDQIISTFISDFESKWNTKPNGAVCVAGICARTNREATRIKTDFNNSFFYPTIIGEPGKCYDQLMAIQQKYNVDEIIFMDLCYKRQDKLRCYELLAKAFDLA